MSLADADSNDPYISLQLDRAHSARMYDYYLGGKTNYGPDREAAAKVAEVWPNVFVAARENRSFMHRATHVLARDHGLRQWLDIGTGIPTSPNLHEVAQSIVPEARVVYADHDPIVLAHARAFMNSTPEGHTAYVQADASDPEAILASEGLAEALDLDKPVALSLNALLHFLTDEVDPYRIVGRLMDALPSGSALAITHCTPEFDPATWQGIYDIYSQAGTPVRFRTREEVARFFTGLELLEPGIVLAHRWRSSAQGGGPRLGEQLSDAHVSLWAGVAIKP